MTRILALGLVAMALLFAAPRAQTAIGQGSSLDRTVRNIEDMVYKMDAVMPGVCAIRWKYLAST